MNVAKILVTVCFVLSLSGCQGDLGFPENQNIDGPFHLNSEWQTIQPDPPLQINREGFQSLHIVVDEERYQPNHLYDTDDIANLFNLHREDGVLVKPQVVLVADNGQEISLHATGSTALYEGGLTVGLSTYAGQYSPAPPFPENIESFTTIRIRSNEPLTAQHLRWRVDRHPDHHRCGNRRCSWWDNLFQ